METVTLNNKELNALATKNPTAQSVMSSLASRQRMRTFSDIRRTQATLVKEGDKIVEDDFMQFWKDLEKAGVGSIVYGRKGRANRFQWHFSLKDVAKAALEDGSIESNPIEKKAKASPKAKGKRGRPRKIASAVETANKIQGNRFVYVALARAGRPDFNVEVNLPGDISQEEVDTVCKALKRISA